MQSNRQLALKLLKNYQKKYLKIKYKNDYPKNLERINSHSNFEAFMNDFIDQKELTEQEKEVIKSELRREIDSTNMLNTEFEAFSDWRILKNIYTKFSELNPQYDLTSKLYLGTVLSHEIYAGAQYEEDIDALFVLFDGELINLNLQLAKIISQSIPLSHHPPYILFPVDLEALYKNICANETVRGRIIGGLYFSIYKYPTDYTPYLLNNELQETVTAILIESMEYFTFSHEVGHYLNGDFRKDARELSFAEKLKKDWDDEFQADLFGLNKLIELYRANNNLLSLLGAEIFFNFLISREKYDKRIKDDISHPPATERLKSYRVFLENFLDEDEIRTMHMFQSLLDSLFIYFEILLNDFVKFNSKIKSQNVS